MLSEQTKKWLWWRFDQWKFRVRYNLRSIKHIVMYVWNTPGRLVCRWGTTAQFDWYVSHRRAELAEKRARRLEEALKLQAPVDATWKEECARLQTQVKTLRADITEKRVALERKNRELDSLHFVWCNGGCGGGVHRFDGKGPDGLNEETVRAAVHNVNRMVTYFNNAEFRHLDTVDEDGVHNRFVYIYGTRAIKDAIKAHNERGPEAAWAVIQKAIDEKHLRG
jgi:hypothetical protein